MAGQGQLLLQLLIAATAVLHAHAYTYTSWHECSAQAVYGGIYGAEVLGNLSDFKSNLLTHVWQTFDPEVPAAQVSAYTTSFVVCLHYFLCCVCGSWYGLVVALGLLPGWHDSLISPGCAAAGQLWQQLVVMLGGREGHIAAASSLQDRDHNCDISVRSKSATHQPATVCGCLAPLMSGCLCAQGFKRFDPVRPFIKCPPHQPLIRYGNPAGVPTGERRAVRGVFDSRSLTGCNMRSASSAPSWQACKTRGSTVYTCRSSCKLQQLLYT